MFESENGARVGAATALVGVSLLYFGTRFALSAWASDKCSAPGRRAVVQWLPVLATVASLVALGNPQMAIGVIFGTSVACLSLVLGLAAMTGPLHDLPPSRRVWPLVLPGALLVMLIGFRGSFMWYHAIMLLAMGGAIMAVWRERIAESGPPFATPVAKKSTALPPALVAIILTILTGVTAVAGGIDTRHH
jgi:Ca2+/Na+ antiporter